MYLNFLYHSILFIGQNEFGPVNKSELAFVLIMLMISLVLNSLIFGQLASLMSALQKEATLSQLMIDSAYDVMDSIQLSSNDSS